jgi:hypothetical protein
MYLNQQTMVQAAFDDVASNICEALSCEWAPGTPLPLMAAVYLE